MSGRMLVFTASALLCAPALSAQSPLSVGSELGFHSAYEARGLTMTETPVLQVSVDVRGRAAAFDLFAGAWANVEPHESAARRRMLPMGVSGPSEVNLYAGVARGIGPLTLETGAIRFIFPEGFDFSEPHALTELYGSVGVAVWGEPSLAAYHDFAARGWYAEARVGREVPLGAATLRLDGELGGSLGQADADEYYGADGLTHGTLSSALVWRIGPVSLGPAVSWTCAIDEAAFRGVAPNHRGTRSKGVVGFTLTWTTGAR